MPLEKLIARLEQLDTLVTNQLDAELPNELQNIADMQRERLEKGINTKGTALERNDANEKPYSKAYTKIKRAKGGQVAHVDLKLNGDYHEGIRAYKSGKMQATIKSIDFKDEILASQYNDILGLSPDQEKEFGAEYAKSINKVVRKFVTDK